MSSCRSVSRFHFCFLSSQSLPLFRCIFFVPSWQQLLLSFVHINSCCSPAAQTVCLEDLPTQALKDGAKLEKILRLHLFTAHMSSGQTTCFSCASAWNGCYRFVEPLWGRSKLQLTTQFAMRHRKKKEEKSNKICNTRTPIPGHSNVKKKERQWQEMTRKDFNNSGEGNHFAISARDGNYYLLLQLHLYFYLCHSPAPRIITWG